MEPTAAELVPPDFAAFRSAGKELDYDGSSCEAGQVKLYALEDLAVIALPVDSDDNHPDASLDPHAGEPGAYAVTAIDLVSVCDPAYEPVGILVYLPTLGVFGTCDCDHWDLRVFPGVAWDQIAADPSTYVDAQWKGEGVLLAPWEHGFPRFDPT